MAINVERLLQRDLDRWIRLLGLAKWRITWDVLEGPLDHEPGTIARTDYKVKRTGRRQAHIRFDRAHMTSPAKIEETVIHELLHLIDHGIGNDAHKLIYRLERPLRLVRKRLTRR